MQGQSSWQVTAQVSTERDGWQSSRQLPTFTIPGQLAPTLGDAIAKVRAIINPYGDLDISFDLYSVSADGSEVYRAWKESAGECSCGPDCPTCQPRAGK
jgi:hypothetical protein